MLSDEVIDKVVERLVNRIEQGNEYVLKKIGESVKKVGTLTNTSKEELEQILKYGGDYEKIVKELTKVTELNVTDIKKIFREIAKNDDQFAEQFYKYRSKKHIPFDENKVLQRQVNALAEITAEEYINLSKTTSLGFGWQDAKGNIKFKGLKETYYDIIDEAILNISQGKETFDEVMYKRLKQIGESGVRVIYPTTYIDKNGIERHYTRRLDSAVRMNVKDGIRMLHNETQRQFGKEFDADMIEITVHLHPAPDHLMQGHQFLIKEYEKLQNGENAKDLKGNIYSLDHDNNGSYRPISTMNCYHYIFYGIAGISEPAYTDDELQNIINENEKGFTYENKHYSMYEGEQLLRKIELELRKNKEKQILGVSSNNVELINESQKNISILTSKYKEILNVSGLSSKLKRARISGYRRVNISKLK